MGRLTQIRFLACIILGAIALSPGCAPDPLFMECPLSNSIKATCEANAESIVYTCVVAEHPYCLESICASWQGSPAECSQACAGDSDCPEGASCQAHLDMKFCIRNIHLNAHVFDLPDVQTTD